MCGIAGYWSDGGLRQSTAYEIVARMAGAIRHRGPDAHGAWVDTGAGIALGHRRLSILDLSPAGAQPMQSASGRYILVFNGEIYNHCDLRREIGAVGGAPAWRGHSDTETLLAAVERWGIEAALGRACGMFALAVWDQADRSLTLARDRLGEKPLYYGWSHGALLFGSELKALIACPGFDSPLDPAAITAFLRYGYVPEPASIFADVRKLPPGSLLRLTSPRARPDPSAYWSLEATALAGLSTRLEGTPAEHEARAEACLSEVVQSQMLSDVPIGCFLSGGIDSSLVAAMMQRAAAQPVRSFSIGFESARFDESAHARLVARHLGTRHTEFVLTEADALAVIPDLPQIYDEPFADSSQIPTILLSRLARREVTVALTGDGGDEVFGGYNRHVLGPGLWGVLQLLRGPGRALAFRAIAAAQGRATNDGSRLHAVARRLGLPLAPLDKLAQFADGVAGAADFAGFYRGLASSFADPAAVLQNPASEALPASLGDEAGRRLSKPEWLMAMDSITYLPGDILVKVDRAAMSASLETRAPFLDRRVVELAWRLPIDTKVRGRTGKRILRNILGRHLPLELIDRPKQGFSIPLDRWLRQDLRDWAEHQLSGARLEAAGLLEAEAVGAIWQRHLAGRENAGPRLWNVLMLQAWLNEHRAPASETLTAARIA